MRRPKRDATTGATARPMRVEPVAETIGHAVVGGEGGADVGAALHDLVQAGGRADIGRGTSPAGRRTPTR